jgi:hypothetical protein
VLDVDTASLDVITRLHPGGCDAEDVDETISQASWALRSGGLLVLTVPLGPQGAEGAVGPADVRGIRATVTVTVPALTLLADEGISPEGPAVVEGVGPIPIQTARDLCGGSADWMRVLTHPETGVVLSVGRKRYPPPKPLRDIVTWRAGRCMGPGCGMPASRCQVDHSIAWIDGGHTSLDNLAPLCTGHHTIKHHGGWRIAQIHGSGGALEWTSPAGRRYVVQPERAMPFFRPDPMPEPRREPELAPF